MQARRGGAAPPRDAREVDSAIGRLTYEHGGADALETVLSRLPWRDLVRAREVCRVWRDAASRDAPWKAHCDALFFAPVPGYHVRVARWDIGAVPAHFLNRNDQERDESSSAVSQVLSLIHI